MRFTLFIIIVVACSFGLYLSIGQTTTSVVTTNTMCPVMPDEPIDPSIFVVYKEQKIFLCCKRCVKKFNENPEKYLMLVKIDEQKIEQSFIHRTSVFIGKLHPIGVHFPIALFFSSLIAFGLYWRSKNDFYITAHRFCLLSAAVSGVIAMILGFTAYFTSSYKGELANIVEYHKILGSLVAIFLFITAFANEKYLKTKGKSIRVILTLSTIATTILIGITGYLGSVLIHGLEHYRW